MDNDKIENNPSYQKFKKDLEGAEALQRLTKLFSVFGVKNDELGEVFSRLPDLKNQTELLSKSPDKFNGHFSKRGWIAHESMSSDLMLTSIELADKGLIDIAEKELTNYYSSDKMHWLLRQVKSIDAFSVRYNLLKLAYEDTIAERYHSSVPILLMMIDGAVNDIDKSKGFFAENTNLTAWDSIAAHSTGLSALKEIFSDSRKKTNSEEITLPFRHGILHGRDLCYANKMVTAKCWAALFAIKDWAFAIKQGKKNPPPPEPELTFEENLSQLKKTLDDYSESKKRNESVSKKVEEWKARQLLIGIDIPEKGASNDYKNFTPEQEAIRFAEYWSKNNFGSIAKQIHHFIKGQINEKKEAGKTRKVFEGKKLLDYKIVKVVDCSPAITEVSLAITVEHENKQCNKEITLRFIYDGPKGEILIFGDTGGQWKFIENFFHQIQYIY
ncbi:MAG: zinc chelation protein SecC [Bacteroidetes bacterium]|nr:zinc chelation protein SecC [Bacteroidota bacterium]